MAIKTRLLWFPLLVAILASLSCYKSVRESAPAYRTKPIRSASADEIIESINKTSGHLNSLQSSSLEVNAEGKNTDTGEIEEYKNVPGYVFLERPKNIRLKILIPLSRTTLFDMASNGQEFQIWYPRENKFFIGKNSIDKKSLHQAVKNTLSNLRPQHLFDAVLIEKLPSGEQNRSVSVKEKDEGTNYFYVVDVIELLSAGRHKALREIWIDRTDFSVTRQVYYNEAGAIISDVKYKNYISVETFSFPSIIRLDQPGDKYSVTLSFKSVKLNQALSPDTFDLHKPPGAQLVNIES